MSTITSQRPTNTPLNETHQRNSLNCDFTSKFKLESELSGRWRRSHLHQVPEKAFVYDVLRLKPPDFNPQAFKTKTCERNSRDAMRPWRFESLTSYKSGSAPTSEQRRQNDKRKNEYFDSLRGSENERARTCQDQNRARKTRDFRSLPSESMRLRFRVMDPYEARLKFVKEGTRPKSPYTMPQPHDYRQYASLKSLGLDEFETRYDHDCQGLKCKARGLTTIKGRTVEVLRQVEIRSRSDYEKLRPLKWDPELMLPKLAFPNKIAAFSRHRRTDRSARSAFLERAEVMMEKRRQEIEVYREKFNKTERTTMAGC